MGKSGSHEPVIEALVCPRIRRIQEVHSAQSVNLSFVTIPLIVFTVVVAAIMDVNATWWSRISARFLCVYGAAASTPDDITITLNKRDMWHVRSRNEARFSRPNPASPSIVPHRGARVVGFTDQIDKF